MGQSNREAVLLQYAVLNAYVGQRRSDFMSRCLAARVRERLERRNRVDPCVADLSDRRLGNIRGARVWHERASERQREFFFQVETSFLL